MRAFAVSLLVLVVAAPALGADGEPKKALTAKGQAIAKSIVLKRSDLSAGFVPHKPSDDPRPKGARCGAVDESDLTVTGDTDSPDFSRDASGIAVGSSATVYRSARESNTAWRRAATAAAVQCFADLVRLTAPTARKVKIVSAKRIRFPAVPSNSIAYRVVATMNIGGSRTIRAYFDAVLLQRGTVQAALVVTSLGSAVPLEQERALAGLMAVRMAKAAPTGPVA
ncbi:MAG TPA: hypothetical protein VGF10_00550 [Gaiella sp.]|jgi:hypothetical protein